MRPILYYTALFATAAGLVFFCSCERHKAEELAEEHGPAGMGEKGPQTGEAHEAITGGDQHTNMRTSPTPGGTPAQFFPSPTPH